MIALAFALTVLLAAVIYDRRRAGRRARFALLKLEGRSRRR